VLGPSQQDNDFPYWLVLLGGIVAYLGYQVVADELYSQVLGTLSKGIRITVLVTLIGFSLAASLGLILALMSLSKNIVIRQIARFYIEVVRGIPIIVLLLYVAFVVAPGLVGQIEAAQTLGLSRWQRFRYVVFPQAIRTILPPLGNDFVAMVKDSSLVSVLGVGDITQLGKVTAAGNFRYFETYNVVALIYLTLTVGLSLTLRRFERQMRQQ